ncbi:cell wall-binding repeat-containing protein [Ornithinicoccus hortensis]|uniref:Putative cell wall-binding protein n=1 Tax=Ornithinicoccus hortensis TaxID=82346 RepID=A0A542YWI2_9MICO|nr:cell wall-binding repeat-containing protein [Ornithinicoccus hortensis]TQL52458.1 putative cell wall-binding protein [Ornithinicoccus hortensis]
MIAPLGMSAATAAPQLDAGEKMTYIVQLRDTPIAAYQGGVSGIPATSPAPGQKLDMGSNATRAYSDYLADKQASALSAAGVSSDALVTSYDVAFNGFAVELTRSQLAGLNKNPDVVQVWEDEIRTADTVQTPDYLGLSGDGGVWDEYFGGYENAGDGIVVGVIDTGIDPLNPSFSDEGMSEAPEGFTCDPGEDYYAEFECNNKVIGARYYGAEYGNTIIPEEFVSARDYNGHGSHTAGTSAGNHGVDIEILGAHIGEGSGMAPKAHIAVYKGLWMTSDGNGSGTTAGLVQAIDDATADGVDVINYSISGSSTNIMGPDETAFLFAADAGIFVSTSAGNSGDTVGESSVAHNAPWTMTVAASTHNRGATNSVTLGDGTTFDGVGYGGPLEATELVNAVDIPAEGVDASEADLCATGAVDDEGAAGKVVVCTRGAYALVDKAAELIDSGAAGMVLINDPAGAGGQNAIIYGLPATHLLAEDGQVVKAYAATDGATAEISDTDNTPVNAPEMAAFSSYGPALAGNGDLLKPDITAPGVDVAAAYHASHDDPGVPTFNQISGTSMSAPHIAGLGALMKQEFPEWSPAAIKSAMMTSARQTDDSGAPIQRGGADASPLDYGAGEVQPAPSYNPGLIYDAGTQDWLNYACAIDQLDGCDEDIDASDLNYPSISIGALAGAQTVTRTVTNVGDAEATYTAEVEAPAGTTATVEPSTFTVAPGETATYELTLQVTTAPLGEYTFGAITWSDGAGHDVRSPIAVLPSAFAVDDEVAGEGVEGDVDVTVNAGVEGTASAGVEGLAEGSIETVPLEASDQYLDDGALDVTIPEGTSHLRLQTWDEDYDGIDLDLFFVDLATGQIVAQSAVGGSTEQIDVSDIPAGDYFLAIDWYDGAEGDTMDAYVTQYIVPAEDAGNLTVDPAEFEVAVGDQVDVNLAWTGLNPDSTYLGEVNWAMDGQAAGRTFLTVDTSADAEEPVVERWSGQEPDADRYGTAAVIAAEFGSATTAYVTTGEVYADALVGSAPAASGMRTQATPGGDAAPVLLVHQDSVPDVTSASLADLGVENIVILGGTSAVSEGVEAELAADYSVERISGSDRYETAAELAKLYTPGVEKVYVAVGQENETGLFADALSGAALAGAEGVPVLLTRTDEVPDATAEALEYLQAEEVVVLGGTAAVSEAVEQEIGADSRIGGKDRYATSAMVADAYEAGVANTLIASGRNWPDALAGASYAGTNGIPVLLTRPTDVPESISTKLDELSPERLVILGGTSAVSQDVEDALNEVFPF